MKSIKTTFFVLITVICVTAQPARGQVKVFFSDLLNGAVNGLVLGGATMALQDAPLDMDHIAPLRIGLGAGIIYGAGVGVYDITRTPKGQPLYISGTFNSGKNSSIIVLLDTFYGIAAGAALGSAVTLITGEYILEGIQYGAAAGAWLGFGFGLIDSFVLSEGPEQLMVSSTHTPSPVAGIVRYSSPSGNVHIGLLHPTVMGQPVIKGTTLKRNYALGVEVINLNIRF